MPKKAALPSLVRIATWNINSVRLRIGNVARLVAEHAPDILGLQETKAGDDVFPDAALAEMGFTHPACPSAAIASMASAARPTAGTSR